MPVVVEMEELVESVGTSLVDEFMEVVVGEAEDVLNNKVVDTVGVGVLLVV